MRILQLLSDIHREFLQHQRTINGPMIAGLSALLPRPSPVCDFQVVNQFERMDRFMHGYDF
jgi:hypothetical protein